MKYWEYLANKDNSICPFCVLKKEEILDQNQTFFVIVCRSPYSIDHIMILPKRHVVLFDDLDIKEKSDLFALVDKRNNKLHENHKSVWRLLRDSLSWTSYWKTIDHLHFHLIPDTPIGAFKSNTQDREYFDEEKYLESIEKVKKKYTWK